MHGERSEKLCTVLRIESVLKSRKELIEKQNPYLPTGGKYKLLHETLLEAYDNLEEAYVDIIIAEAKCLEHLKEMGKHTNSKELIMEEDLKYLRELAEKEFRVNKHEKNKEPCVTNISLNVDKDIDIETIANELVEKLKSVSI